MENNNEALKEKAKNKLKDELKNTKDKSFAEPVIEYLLKRCEEDMGVVEDILLEHKNWTSCYDYIYAQARKKATGNSVAIRDDIVFEWAEDYYHKEYTEEEKNKDNKISSSKKVAKKTEQKKESKTNIEKVVSVPKTKKEHKKNDSLEGQMSIFDLGL